MDLHSTARHLPDMLRAIERLIAVETPSADLDAVARGAAAVAELLQERLGRAPETIVLGGVTHLRLRFGSGRPRVVLLTHQDTVWPIGTLDRLPCSIRDGVLRGPGCFDMLTGLVMAIHAVALLGERHGPDALDGISLLVTGDEEVGSTQSRALILEEAAGAEAVLVLEASAERGALKLGRKGVSRYRLEVVGRAAHAGLEPERGINAGLELARQMPAIAELSDAALGTTVTPTSFAGGTTSNTVPASATLDVDSRAWTVDEQRRVDAGMRALRPSIAGAELLVTGEVNRPPMERSASEALFAQYRRIALELGAEAPAGVDVGGASDGNFTAGAGIPTLDGLGAVGGGAHAEHEHVLVAQIAPRTAVLAALLRHVLTSGERP